MKRLPRVVRCALFLLAVSPTAPALRGQETPSIDRPLPEVRGFLDKVRQGLHTDDYLLEEYTFTERRLEQRLDGNGRIKEEKREVFEVYPSARAPFTYRRLVERDGRPLPAAEIAEQDRDHEKKVAKATGGGATAEEKRRRALAEREQRERKVVDELFDIYDIAFVRRESLEGRLAILVTFQPRPGIKPSTRAGKVMQKFSGRAWVDEEDYQVVRAEAELLDTFSYGLGVLARLYKGAVASFQRRKVNGEVWLPSEARFRGKARLLLLKGLHVDSRSEYSDYKKFQVATDEAITPEKGSP